MELLWHTMGETEEVVFRMVWGAQLLFAVVDGRSVSNESRRDITNGISVNWNLTEFTSEPSTEKNAQGLEREGDHSSLHFQADFPSTLHHQSLTSFKAVAPYISTCPELENSSHSLIEDLGRLYLAMGS